MFVDFDNCDKNCNKYLSFKLYWLSKSTQQSVPLHFVKICEASLVFTQALSKHLEMYLTF